MDPRTIELMKQQCAAFDSLPAAIRRIVREADVPVDATTVAMRYRLLRRQGHGEYVLAQTLKRDLAETARRLEHARLNPGNQS